MRRAAHFALHLGTLAAAPVGGNEAAMTSLAALTSEDGRQIDALFTGSGCEHVYLDVGTNRGVQIRKLFWPSLYPKASVRKFFNHASAPNKCRVHGKCLNNELNHIF